MSKFENLGSCILLTALIVGIAHVAQMYAEISRDHYVLTVVQKCVGQAAERTKVESESKVDAVQAKSIREEFKINVDACLIDEEIAKR